MANSFRQVFERLAEETDFVRFGKFPVNPEMVGGNIIEIIPSSELVASSMRIAEEKSLKTMASSQNLHARSSAEKVNQSCRGVLGEACMQLLLTKQLNIPKDSVKRFDLERESFVYSPDEYDLKVNNLRIEVRTSNNPASTIDDYLGWSNRGVICTYTNNIKSRENESDFYFGIVYDYPGLSGRVPLERKVKFSSEIIERQVKMYLVGGVSNYEKEKFGIATSMGQRNTNYKVVPFQHCRNVLQVIDELGSCL
jgi:hypothetical protein